MRKYLFILLSLSAGIRATFAQQSVTLEDIFTKGTFAAKGVPGFNSLKDGRYYCALDNNQNIIRYSFATGNAVDTLVKASNLLYEGTALTGFNYTWSNDETKLLLETNVKSIYRHSYSAMAYVYDLKSGKMTRPSAEPIQLAELSPDGKHLAYVRSNNLFYYDITAGIEFQISANGKQNTFINGGTDWVYEEEFALSKGFYWSPKGDAIAYYEFNETNVPQYEMAIYGSLYPEQEKFKYPKAGEANSIIRILTFDIATSKKATMDIGNDTDIYIPRIYWTKNNTIFIQRLNRIQNKLEFLIADAKTGESNVIYVEDNKAYIDIPEIFFLSDGKSFIVNSEKDGWNHLYQYEMSGDLIAQITKGTWDIDQFYGINEKTKTLYASTSEVHSMERYIYAISLDGKSKKQITQTKGWNSATFNSDFTYFLSSSSTLNTPAKYSLCDVSGKEVRILEDNKALTEKMKSFVISKAEMTSYKNQYNENLNAFIIKPLNFDPSKKHPVLMYVYGGPGHQLAVNRWMGGNYFWYQLLADKGYIIVCTDGRGTGFKGESFKKSTYLQLGKFEIEDQIFVAKQLAKLSYVDPSRIGIWGWSFGGYMASLGISKGADVFKTAIAVAPVTNWRYYDNIYTERFMRKPQDNGKNYDDNSPINHVDKIKGNYLIIHGTADDNVHFQNTVEMVNAMINKGVKYDSEFYPNKNHGIGGSKTRLHLYDRMTRFILEKL